MSTSCCPKWSIRSLEKHAADADATARAAIGLMKGMIDRGFTSVRDTGGADWGIKEAVEKGDVAGRRACSSPAQAIGPTGGHSDPRRRTDFGARCHCCNAMAYTMNISDGVSSVHQVDARADAARGRPHQDHDVGRRRLPLRPARLTCSSASRRSRRPLTEEAAAFGRYVCAHAYTPEAITRAAHCGVRAIEHGNLIDEASAKLMAENNMFLTANLVAYYAMKRARLPSSA